jgi:hypothetical protein
MTQAIRSASCECQCRQVKLRAREYDDGAIGVEELTATYSHSDVDCESRSATSIATPFDRDFPAINSDCTAADAVEITVVSAPSGKSYHWGWLIESEGDAPQTILEPGALNLQLENTGPFVVVVGLFSSDSPGDDGTEQEPGCSDEYDFPGYISLTRPATLDFSSFDTGGGYCSDFPRGRTAVDKYDLLGNTPLTLRCYGSDPAERPGGDSYFQVGDLATNFATYRYMPRRPDLRRGLDVSVRGATTHKCFGGTGAYRRACGCNGPILPARLNIYSSDRKPRKIYSYWGKVGVLALATPIDELCSNTDSFLSMSGACSELASLVAMPLRKSGGQTFVGVSRRKFAPALRSAAGFYSAPPRFPNTFIADANCLNSVMSSVVDSIVSGS